MYQGGWRLRAPKTNKHGRGCVAGLASLALVAVLSGLSAAPAVAVEDTDHVALPKTGYAAEVVAASNGGFILAPAGGDGSSYRVSADNGQSFTDLTAAPHFSGVVSYVGGSKVMYVDPTGDSDAGGNYYNLYTYDLATDTTPAPVKVYTSQPPLAVSAEDAVVVDDTVPSGFVAVHLADGARTPLLVPDHGEAPRFTLNGSTALAATSGFLDSVPLNGAAATSKVVHGLVTARVAGARAYWIETDHTEARFCMAVSATLGSDACKQLAAGDYAAVPAALEAGNGWVVARLGVASASPLEYVYVLATDHITPVTPASGMQSLKVYGRGDTDTPLATVLAASGGYVGTYSAGTVAKLFDLPETAATPSALSITPQSVSGLDNRPAEGVSGQQAWTRPLEGVSVGAEELLSPRATELSASGDRILVAAADGAHVFDAGQAGPTLAGLTDARSLSGPYFLSGPASNAVVRRVDGTSALASAGHVVGLFGSLALRTAGPDYQVVDAENAAHTWPVDLAAHCGSGTFVAEGLWGDWVLAQDTASEATVVLNYRTSTCVRHSGVPAAIGDGFALVLEDNPVVGTPDLKVWNFRNGDDALLAGPPSTVATDGSHKVAWTDAAGLWTSTVDDIVTPSAPRVLGVLAPDSVLTGTDWTLQLDASKGLRDAGLGLEITGPGGSAQLPVDAAPNGSVRLTWDGTIGPSPAPAGTYTWELKLFAGDNSGALVNTDGSSTVTGTFTVTGTAGTVTGTTPTLSTTTPVVDESVTAVPGVWTPEAGVTLSYQWYRGSTPIYRATSATYTPVVDDLGSTLMVAVTGKATGKTAVTKNSAPSAEVTWVAGPVPTLSRAIPVVGKPVTARPGTWAPAGVNGGLTYQWYRDATPIDGATAATYVPSAADLGHTLHVTVTGALEEHPPVSQSSAPSGTVISPSFVPTVPVLSTTRPVVDQTVTAVPGAWGTDVTFTYQWYRVSGKARAISGATHASYVASAKDVGKKLKVKVTGTGLGTKALYSKSSAKVKKASFVLTTPLSITGTARVGQPITVSGTWSAPPTLKYQWYRGSKAIKKAKAKTYLLTAADLNKVMKVKVTASRSGYNTAVKTVKLATPVGPAV